MASNSALDILIDLATKQSDEAAKRLGRAIKANGDATQKLAMLQQYREDYVVRFQAQMSSSGVTAAAHRNFQGFISKLDEAIAGQQRVVNDAERRVGMERTAWQGSERKRMSYDILADRKMKAQQLKDTRREQKQTDEFAARKLLDKR
jgi:flagellar FliJ protein